METVRKTLRATVAWALLLLLLVWAVFPILFVVHSSLKHPREIFDFPPRLLTALTDVSYQRLLRHWPQYFEALRNSVLIAAASVVLTLLTSAPAAYAYSRYRSLSLNLSAVYTIAIRMVPPIVLTIPLYPLFHRYHLIDRHVVMAVLYAVFYVSVVTWILKTFVDEVPLEVEEAAWLDGCTRMRGFVYVVLPMLAPGLMVAAVFTAIFAWNEFLFAFIFTASRARTAPVMINEMLGAWAGELDWGVLFAASTLHLVPMLLLTWLIHRWLARGMIGGAVKG